MTSKIEAHKTETERRERRQKNDDGGAVHREDMEGVWWGKLIVRRRWGFQVEEKEGCWEGLVWRWCGFGGEN